MIVLTLGKGVLRGIYALHKLAPVKRDRITFLSRQANEPSVDILLLQSSLKEAHPELDIRVLCKTLDPGLAAKAGYLCHMIGPQMHALATSKLVVLDGYCIAVSILKHKPSLTVVQMWHAMGSLKKFGKSILDQKEGSSRDLAETMHMHEGYDYILASSKESAKYFADAFGYDESAFAIYPLPRTDLLKDKECQAVKRTEIEAFFPELAGKKILLYAPTMRKTEEDISKTLELAEEVAKRENYRLVIAPHPGKREPYEKKQDALKENGAILLPPGASLDCLLACDVFISDYSAMIYEAAVAGKPIALYAYDLGDYVGNRGFYMDYQGEMPVEPHRTAKDVLKQIDDEAWDGEIIKMFSTRYIEDREENTKALADWLYERMNRR